MVLPKIITTIRITQDKQEYPFIVEFEPTEDEMDRFEDLIGDGNAKVTVGMDAGEKDYGNGFGMFLSVSLTCDQTEDGLDDGFDAAVGVLRTYAPDVKKKVEEIYKEVF